jgi:hypothetical protein
MPASSPKRRYRRIGLPNGPFIAWRGTGERVVSRVETLGLGGVFIITPEPLMTGEALQVYFEVPGGEVRAKAVVRSSCKGKGMGIEFTAMDPDARARLHKLLSRLLGDPYTETVPAGKAG